MIRRRAAAAGIAAMLGNHGLRATGITAYPKNGGTLEKAAQMASHATTRTIKLYDRRRPSVPMKVRHQRCGRWRSTPPGRRLTPPARAVEALCEPPEPPP